MTFVPVLIVVLVVAMSMAVAKAHGALTMVHAENNGMIKWMSKRLLDKGLTAPRYHAVSHPALAEEEAIHRAISLAKLADAALMIVRIVPSAIRRQTGIEPGFLSRVLHGAPLTSRICNCVVRNAITLR